MQLTSCLQVSMNSQDPDDNYKPQNRKGKQSMKYLYSSIKNGFDISEDRKKQITTLDICILYKKHEPE